MIVLDRTRLIAGFDVLFYLLFKNSGLRPCFCRVGTLVRKRPNDTPDIAV
jgi:hypothetical protein